MGLDEDIQESLQGVIEKSVAILEGQGTPSEQSNDESAYTEEPQSSQATGTKDGGMLQKLQN